MKLSQLKLWGKSNLKWHANEVNLLLCAALDVDENFLLTNPDYEVSDALVAKFEDFVAKRMRHMPIQHILGKWSFMGLTFTISPNALIPREDTEVLVNAVLSHEPQGAKGLEIGLGSGCISISLEHHGKLDMVGVDICPQALEVARTNYQNIIGKTPNFVLGDLYQGVAHGTFDFIVSNPPYIPSPDIISLDESVTNYEPLHALDGGVDGLDFYRRLASNPPLKKGGRIYLEIGYNQAEDVEKILINSGFSDIVVLKDLSGHDRVVHGKFVSELTPPLPSSRA
ncbi:MAG: peptide chain release factor N(5)-glutamine methyltransferase [Defluviitaleaceae bacterium]|nr:peptide chain release factor N(5)-glutamine methyltransferase [Defluviitaleaceae bacterium]